jgi:hypothetical protein
MSLLDDRGQSAPLGMALLLGLMLIGTTAVVAFGSTALSDTQQQSDLAKAEQTMTLFDSQTAQVALGDASIQTVNFGQAEGNYEVRPNTGTISIVQHDCNDSGSNDDSDDIVDNSSTDDDAYILSPRDLGEVVYTKEGKTIAYQGGGVWRKDNNGGSTMISPPEFHYRGATLTLPIIMTRGSGAGSGSLSAQVEAGETAPVFPHPTEVFPNGSLAWSNRNSGLCWEDGEEEPFENPITDGNVTVRIQSEYADAWGRYFETRTEGEVKMVADDEVHINLVSLGQVGDFQMPGEGGSVTVAGASDGHEVEEFNVTLRPDDADAAQFNNLQWSMYAEEGDHRLEIHLTKSGSGDSCDGGSTGTTADMDLYFSDDGGDTYEVWHADSAFEAHCDDLNGNGDDDQIVLKAHFVDDPDGNGDYEEDDGGDPSLEYTDKSGISGLNYFNIQGSDGPADPAQLDGHGASWESFSATPNNGDTNTTDRLINHYFAEMPSEFDLVVDDKNSDTINEGSSGGTLVTGASGRYVTYLHVTRNEVEVELD